MVALVGNRSQVMGENNYPLPMTDCQTPLYDKCLSGHDINLVFDSVYTDLF
jgi:hypothetical protein